MTWFERLTGINAESCEQVRKHLTINNERLYSSANQMSWRAGTLEIPTLADLRSQVQTLADASSPGSLEQIVADVTSLHKDPGNAGALFQVASQFNLLEMTSPSVSPEAGLGIYENDFTQGPACAIAAGAGTIYRNYFVPLTGVSGRQTGQSSDLQIDCLADVGRLLDNSAQKHWQMRNGYMLPTVQGLSAINAHLESGGQTFRDELRSALRIGLQWNTQVTLNSCRHVVSQAYCSAVPVAYCRLPETLWQPFATLVLEAAYEATMCAARLNARQTGCNVVYLTLLGGGAFGNSMPWILQAIHRAMKVQLSRSGLCVKIVSYRQPNTLVQQLVDEFSQGRSRS